MTDKPIPSTVVPHPTSALAKQDAQQDRHNIARQMRQNQMMREMARELIDPQQQINDLFEIDLALQGEKDSAGNPIPLDRDIQSALVSRANIKFKLLNKVMPDIKATESTSFSMHEHGGTIGVKKVSDVELAARLHKWTQEHGDGHMRRAKAEESCVEATFEEVKDDYDFL